MISTVMIASLFFGHVFCYGEDMSDSDYQVTVNQHGQAGQYVYDNYGKEAAQGCVNGAAAGGVTTGTAQGAAAGCVAGACGNVAQKVLFPN